ncbi:nucleotide-diphospho-sugar transferase [Amanita rubescens]|nr:nucleotide-diphospho-sugar transferase [Amanita rubescens]
MFSQKTSLPGENKNGYYRPDVRIRRDATNIGASGSRNRGMEESAADWIAFLDDDTIPHSDLLVEAEKVIREYPTAAGFAGRSLFPQSQNIFTTAVLISGVAFFFDIATKIKHDIPWGVTANLIARRNIRDDVWYGLSYPKAGGGEDVEFCLRKRKFFLAHGLKGFTAAPKVIVNHPWWYNGHRSYRRFYRWAYADGVLLKRFPEYCYWDYCPNSAELLFLSGLVSIVLPLALPLWDSPILSIRMLVATIVANIIHDCYKHLWKITEHHRGMNTTLTGWKWVMAIIESTGIRLTRDVGRLHGVIAQGDFMIGRRFDLFAGRLGKGPMNEERMDNLQRAIIAVAVFHHLHV